MTDLKQEEQLTAAPSQGSKLPLIVGIAGGVVISIVGGAFLGALVVGPRISPKVSPMLPAPVAYTASVAQASHPASSRPAHLYVIENLVLNPSGSNGSRFLLLSVAIAASNESTLSLLKSRDPEIRDRILGLLGSKSVDEVWEASRREELRQEVLATLKPLFPYESIHAVYFPQFVIQ